jgi:pimeloyl-ACP methyl ester carboxylesterase
MRTLSSRRIAAVLLAGAVAAATTLLAPAVANAAPTCATANGVTSCTGNTSDGAPYSITVPAANFSGTLFLWSHGIRNNVDLRPIGGGAVTNVAEPVPNGDQVVARAMLAQGFAIAGSGFSRQGWNTDVAVLTNVDLIATIKLQFPEVKRIVAWGNSLGGLISQKLAETVPDLVDAVGPLCAVAQGPEQVLANGWDAVWALKTFFDPTIKGTGYSAGSAGYAEALGDVGKIAGVLGSLSAAIAANPTAPAWPTTASPFGKALEAGGIPSRSALVLSALISGIPTRSAHFDGVSGPGTAATAYSFAAAISPALGTLENLASAAVLGVIARLDLEGQVGGSFANNATTDYEARLGDNRDVFSAALSGDTAIDAMLGVLKVAPRATPDPAVLAKLRALGQTTGKVSHPTITMMTEIDTITPAGNQQWYIEQYDKQFKAERKAAIAKAKKLKKKAVLPVRKHLALWSMAPETYTQFTATGSPSTAFAAPSGTTHCNFSSQQYIAVAQMLASAAVSKRLPVAVKRDFLVESTPGLLFDPFYEVELPKSLQK